MAAAVSADGGMGVMGPRAVHVRGRTLPDETLRDLWIVDGVLTDEAPAAPVVEAAGSGDAAFLLPGLVDVHSHISWPHTKDAPADTEAWMDRFRAGYAGLGVAALRDMGSAFNDVIRLPDRRGLPRVRAAGHLLVRNEGMAFEAATPESLVRLALRQRGRRHGTGGTQSRKAQRVV